MQVILYVNQIQIHMIIMRKRIYSSDEKPEIYDNCSNISPEEAQYHNQIYIFVQKKYVVKIELVLV